MHNADAIKSQLRASLGRIAQWWERGELGSFGSVEGMVRDLVIEAEDQTGSEMGVRVVHDEMQDAWRIDILMAGEVIASEMLSVYPSGVSEPCAPRSIDDSVKALCRAFDRLGWVVGNYTLSMEYGGRTAISIEATADNRNFQNGDKTK